MSYILSGMGAAPNQDNCELACYEAKSKAYQACQKLPVGDREARLACFSKADAKLQACLNECSAPSARTVAIIAGVGLLAFELVK